MTRARCLPSCRRVGLVLGCIVVFPLAQHRYIRNFVMGPFDVGQASLDGIIDVRTAPRYFVESLSCRCLQSSGRERAQQEPWALPVATDGARAVRSCLRTSRPGPRLLYSEALRKWPTTQSPRPKQAPTLSTSWRAT